MGTGRFAKTHFCLHFVSTVRAGAQMDLGCLHEERKKLPRVLVGGHREHFSVCAFSREGRQGSDWDGLMEAEERSG